MEATDRQTRGSYRMTGRYSPKCGGLGRRNCCGTEADSKKPGRCHNPTHTRDSGVSGGCLVWYMMFVGIPLECHGSQSVLSLGVLETPCPHGGRLSPGLLALSWPRAELQTLRVGESA